MHFRKIIFASQFLFLMKQHISTQINTAELTGEKQAEIRKVFIVLFSHIFIHQETASFT